MTESPQERLDLALAPDDSDDYDPLFEAIPDQTACWVQGCELPATEWYREVIVTSPFSPDGTAMHPSCADHGDNRFHIDDETKANWALHKLRATRRRLTEIDELYNTELARLDRWRQLERSKHQRQEGFFATHLIRFLLRLRATDRPGKERASHRLPAGRISLARSTAVVVDDMGALVAWAEARDVRLVKKEVQVSAVKGLLVKDPAGGGLQAVTADGEKVPGIRIDPRLNPRVETP